MLLLGASPPVVYWSVTMTRGAGEAVCGAVSGLEWSGSGASERTPGAPPPRAGWGGCFWCLLGAWPAQAVMSGVGARRGRRERGERASKESPFRLLPPPAAAQANKPTTPARLPPRTRARGGGVPAVASASVSSDGRTHAGSSPSQRLGLRWIWMGMRTGTAGEILAPLSPFSPHREQTRRAAAFGGFL